MQVSGVQVSGARHHLKAPHVQVCGVHTKIDALLCACMIYVCIFKNVFTNICLSLAFRKNRGYLLWGCFSSKRVNRNQSGSGFYCSAKYRGKVGSYAYACSAVKKSVGNPV
jgi:hypothetical protein